MLFDSTVRKELARAFGATLVVILTIVLTQMLIQTLGKAADGAVAPQDVVLLLGFGAIKTMPTVLALSLFVAVVVTLGRMYRDSEMAIWFASGIGLSRFVRPVLHMAWPVLVLVGLLGLVVWPWSNLKIEEMRQQYEQRSDLSRVAPGTFQTSRDGSRVFFVEREGEGDSSGTRRSVFMLGRSGEREAVTTARTGRIDTIASERQLVLDGGHRNELNLETGTNTHTQFDSFRMTMDQARAAAVTVASPKVLSMSALIKAPTPANLGELTWRLGLLFGATNLILLGIGTSATNPCLYSMYDGANAQTYSTAAAVDTGLSAKCSAKASQQGDPMVDSANKYHLKAGSPCIDKSTNNEAPSKDMDGQSRPMGSGFDIGPDEAG